MTETTPEWQELLRSLAGLREEVARLAARIDALEAAAPASAVTAAVPAAQPTATAASAPEALPEETVLVIAAALAAYLGKRPKIRQIRLIGSMPWAQQGRVSIQASHRLDLFH